MWSLQTWLCDWFKSEIIKCFFFPKLFLIEKIYVRETTEDPYLCEGEWGLLVGFVQLSLFWHFHQLLFLLIWIQKEVNSAPILRGDSLKGRVSHDWQLSQLPGVQGRQSGRVEQAVPTGPSPSVGVERVLSKACSGGRKNVCFSIKTN